MPHATVTPPSRGGLGDLDLRAVRARYGLTAIPQITVTASELANLGFCEAWVVLSGVYPDQAVPPTVAQRRAAGTQAHQQRAACLRRTRPAPRG